MPSSSTKPPVLLVIGMAGSGKTTLLQRLSAHLRGGSRPPYVLNLDPAVLNVPYGANVDIRDTVNYQQVMAQYNLGPNGGIVTALNLFATKFDQVLALVAKRERDASYVLVDTPGQIEVFTWSASGAIITEAFAQAYPTVVVYVVDTPMCAAPTTFMSNMLYACSILYKTQLPFVVVFNKIDVKDHAFAVSWMQDFEAFQHAVADEREGEEEASYMSSMTASMALTLDVFYKTLRVAGVSALTGEGMDALFACVDEAVVEYEQAYLPMLQARMQQGAAEADAERQASLERLARDLALDKDT